MIAEQKKSLRADALRFLSSLDPEFRKIAGQKIRRHLEAWDVWATAQKVCAFNALSSEPDVFSPWPEAKEIILPRVVGSSVCLHSVSNPNDLVVGRFGILEPSASTPVAEAKADVILVPGLAFDRSGVRMGRGRGYYDRLLADFQGVRVGVCFKESVLKQIPAEPHDALMDFIITPSGIIFCETRSKLRDSVE
jgi:5-formyltetrahydrofolate cyclo-ligase